MDYRVEFYPEAIGYLMSYFGGLNAARAVVNVDAAGFSGISFDLMWFGGNFANIKLANCPRDYTSTPTEITYYIARDYLENYSELQRFLTAGHPHCTPTHNPRAIGYNAISDSDGDILVTRSSNTSAGWNTQRAEKPCFTCTRMNDLGAKSCWWCECPSPTRTV